MQQAESIPYLIAAPHYRDSSSGIQVIHYLCHLLNQHGQRAWLFSCETNPAWNTPVMNAQQLQQLRQSGMPFIAVYPEVVSGNPLQAPHCVRYMLNREAAINGNSLQSGPDDLFFWFRQELADKQANPQLLNLELTDLALFRDEGLPRSGSLLFSSRVSGEALNDNRLPADVEVLSMRKPLTLPALAAKLKTASKLYTFEASGTLPLAILCGCPVVALTARGYEQHAVTPATLLEVGNAGCCFDDSEASLQQARSTIGHFRTLLLEKQQRGLQQLAAFIDITQRHGQQRQRQTPLSFSDGLSLRQPLPAQTAPGELPPRLLIALFCAGASTEQLLASLQSIARQAVAVQVLVIGAELPIALQSDELRCVADDCWRERLTTLCQQSAFDWLHCIPAGSCYPAASLASLHIFLAANPDALAVAGDEIWQCDGQPDWPQFRAAVDWPLYSSAPQLYLQRAVLSRQALAGLGDSAWRSPRAFEYDLLTQLYARHGEQALRLFPDVLLQLAQPQCGEAELAENQAILQADLIRQGYTQASVVMAAAQTLRVHYGHQQLPLVSVIILAGESLPQLERTVTGFLQKNNWPQVELLVVNHRHDQQEVNQWLDGLATIDPASIRVLNSALDWQPVALTNEAASQARGAFLLLLATSALFLLDNWLAVLMNQALRPGVGAVGPKMIQTDRQTASAGVIVGHRGIASHAGSGERWDSLSHGGLLQRERQVGALAGQCLLIARQCWQDVGGLNSQFTSLALAELELQLKVRAAGYSLQWTPHSIIALDGAVSDYHGAPVDERYQFQCHWLPQLATDAGYSARYTLTGTSFTPDESLNQTGYGRAALPLLVLIGSVRSPGAARRFSQQLMALEQQSQLRLLAFEQMPSWVSLLRIAPQALIFLGELALPDSHAMQHLQQHTGCQLLCLADEATTPAAMETFLRWPLLNGWLTFSREQQRWLQKRKQQVRLLPMLVEPQPLAPRDISHDPRPRVLCNLDPLSAAERKLFADVLARSAEFIDWVVLGFTPFAWQPLLAETHRSSEPSLLPAALDALRVDLAVIPRLQQDDSRFKDDWLQLHYLARGIPVLCSAVASLENDWPAIRVRNKSEAWCEQLSLWHQQWQQHGVNAQHHASTLAQLYPLDERLIQAILPAATV